MTNKIPKVVHYFWFGDNDLPELANKCIESWKKYLPDYELKLWNEKNYDVNQNQYLRQAYKSKKYAFVSDYARIDILYKYGGIYMDTDVELLRNLDEFLEHEMFGGFENKKSDVNPGIIFGSVKKNNILKEILNEYERPFIKENGELDLTTIVQITTKVLRNHGMKNNGRKQTFNGVTIYPKIFFAPDIRNKDYRDKIGSNTYSIHHYAASWVDSEVTKRMNKPWWKIIGIVSRISSKIGKKIMGEEVWIKFRNKFFKNIHDKMTTT